LLCYYAQNNLPSALFQIFTELKKKLCVCTSETAAHNFCNTCNETLGVAYFAKDYLSTVFASSFVTKAHIQNTWGECQQVSFLRSQTKLGLFFEILFKAIQLKTLVSFFSMGRRL